jgi:hypothetical protein
MDAKNKISRKSFGRCSCKGHGGKCSVGHEIQSQPISKAQMKKEAKKEIEEQLRDSHEKPVFNRD